MQRGLVGSEMCIRDRVEERSNWWYICIVLAGIHCFVSIVCFMLDFSGVFFLINSGEILQLFMVLIVGLSKHVIQVWWFFILIPNPLNKDNYMVNLIALGSGTLIVGICLIVYVVRIFMLRYLLVDVILHPFVIELYTFIIANLFVLYFVYKNSPLINASRYYSRVHYTPIPQSPSIEMATFRSSNMILAGGY
eukprot:TRINITY_DN36275_c0_g1_i2.p1 TRINITY_DN36275_c0_g1~~TRINITY_DN36275_c0_g1_i2.p1  ORF type:complete len:193 (-),score=15.71 TRINITY_DN36275_c0_g1_i2:167-745(-)